MKRFQPKPSSRPRGLRSLLAVVMIAAVAPSVHAASLDLANDGVHIDADGVGKFTLAYPVLLSGPNKAPVKISEKSADGKTATVKYEGGGTIQLSTGEDALTLKFLNIPAEVKNYKMNMTVDFQTGQESTWKFGNGEAKPFPADKPANPHLFQGNTKTFQLTRSGRRGLLLTVPDYSYQQLDDWREWGQKLFSWQFFAPYNPDWKQAVLKIQDGTAEDLAASRPAAPSAVAPAAEPGPVAISLDLTQRGVQIKATGLGAATLEYPKLAKGTGEYKLVDKSIAGNVATLKYEGGGQISVDASDGARITYKLSGLPDDVKTIQTQMAVGLGEGPNRKWKFDEQAGEFPREKPAKPHLFQGNAKTFTVTNYENRTLGFTVPDNSYQQLTDAREWGQSAFFWTVFTPYIKDRATLSFTLAGGAQGAVKKVVLIDKFGQSTQYDWPLKVKSDEELKADVESEKNYYAAFKPPVLDKFGGLPGSREKLGLRATGFFHVEKKANRWLLADPDGNAFFHLGVCVFGPGDDYTTVKGRESIYDSLPPIGGEFKTAYKPDQGSSVISFHLANQIRKYGEPYSLESYTARMIDRTRKFGFNSVGAFSSAGGTAAVQTANFPFVGSLPLGQWDAGINPLPGTNVWDPFDAGNRAKVEQSFAKRLPARAADPLLIGYFLTNEPLYEDVAKVVPGLKGNQGAKRRLVQFLKEKYPTIEAFNTAWDAKAGTWDELNDAPLIAATKVAAADMQAYVGLFMESYLKLVTETFHKYDQNHLLIGNRLQSGTINNEQLCRLMGQYLDVVSFNYYTYTFDKAFLNRVHGWMGDKPMMLTEFYWSSPTDSGMGSRQDVSNQRERGLAYRNYVENAAALDYVVGIEWFTLVDQATTGRWFSGLNGEAANTGLFSVADRPWKPMVEEMAKSNYAIYDVWLGRQKPFVFDDPRFGQASGGKKTLSISRAAGPMKIDGIADNWPGVPAETISSSRLVAGGKAEGLEASFKLCWDEENLYVLANIVDKTPMQNAQAAPSLWNGDGLELFIGSENLADGGPLLFTDRQVELGGGKSGQVFFNNAPRQYPATTAVVPGVDGKSYTIEAAIPWTALGVTPRDNLDLLFDLAVDDGSGTGRQRQLMWNGTAKNSGDRSYWGKAKLVR